MEGIRQHKDVTSRVIQPSKGKGVHIVDNRFQSINRTKTANCIQRKIGFEFEIGAVGTEKNPSNKEWIPHSKGEILSKQTDYDITADICEDGSQVEFVTKPLDETNDIDLDRLIAVSQSIPEDLRCIKEKAAENREKIVLVSQIARFSGDNKNRFIVYAPNNLSGQLQMTGGVRIGSLPSVISGKAMPETDITKTFGSNAQDFALKYQSKILGTDLLSQPVFQAAVVECKEFKYWNGNTIEDDAVNIMASILTLMAQIPLSTRGILPDNQGLFLARTDYGKILQLFCEHCRILIDGPSFTKAMLSVINKFSENVIKENDSVFPITYKVGDIGFTDVSIKEWTEGVLPSPGLLWGYWKGKDLITQKNYPGSREQKKELRQFGEFGDKTDPQNKIVLEWRNFGIMYPDNLELTMTKFADYLKKLNEDS